ncbi:dual specificity protein phosphatase family protein [Thiomicrorhabdus sp. Kp2]|uniref:fused DSP-PTPase phosphatase/NAD kinase-like protein n=1 Tax=Thiomicrorhabdus sp. Kp2 TaxID=1123518 RepID=UPI00040E1824|nr:dual specificity protein phosphatase family protein [Thiomicrorhabdus sp. Kp2]
MKFFKNSWQRFKLRFENLFVDHEILRMVYRNLYALSSKAYRSNHPSGSFLRKMQKNHGLKTVISMRKANTSASYILEKEACDKLGIKMINHPMSSRKLPKKEMILKAKELLETVEYPILIHCKSGADRAGLMSVFYMHFVEKQPIEEAVKQLSMRFGHFRWADTGKLDFFFDHFFEYKKTHPDIEFLDWVTNIYDRDTIDGEFHSSGWANIVVNKILHRE